MREEDVKTAVQQSDSPIFSIQRGVKQDILSSLIFNIYGEYIIRKALDS